MKLQIKPLTSKRWRDVATLFGPSDAYGHCWCTWWRQPGSAFDAGCANGGAGNRELLRQLTNEGRVAGLLGYLDGAPVGWVSVAPLHEFGRILRSPTLKPRGSVAADDWAIVCFWIPREHRGKGVATELLAGAIAHARAQGARRLEAYPIPTDGAHRDGSSLFTGTLKMFTSAGFSVARQRKEARPVVELMLA